MAEKDLGFIARITGMIDLATSVIYLVIAAVLVLLAGISFYDVILQIVLIIGREDLTGGVLQVLHALLLTIIIIELLETVVIYFRTHQIRVRPILFAGLTAMIRRVLVFGVESTDLMDMVSTVLVIAVLTAAIVLIGKEEGERSTS
jgi:uncharacterized membrane protein (DUF373 family)